MKFKEKLFTEFNIALSTTTVSNYLCGRLFTTKKIHWKPTMNSERNKILCEQFVQALNSYTRIQEFRSSMVPKLASRDSPTCITSCMGVLAYLKGGSRAVAPPPPTFSQCNRGGRMPLSRTLGREYQKYNWVEVNITLAADYNIV